MKYIILALLITSFLMVENSYGRELRVKEYLEWYEMANQLKGTVPSAPLATPKMIINRTVSGISWANALLIHNNRKPLYCQPDSLALPDFPYSLFIALQPEQTISMIREYLKKYPEHSKYPIGAVTLQALMSTFPCKD